MGWSRIRLYSRLAALALFAIMALAASALRVPRAQERFAALSVTSYIVAAPAPRRQTPPPKPAREEHARPLAAAFLAPPASPQRPRLWSYNGAGQIVFDHFEQYRRCLEARAAHHNETIHVPNVRQSPAPIEIDVLRGNPTRFQRI